MQFLMESVQPIYLHDEFDKLGYYADELPEEYRVKSIKIFTSLIMIVYFGIYKIKEEKTDYILKKLEKLLNTW